MKKAFLASLLVLFFAHSASAEVSVGDVHFVACGDCTSDLEFELFVKHYSKIAPDHSVLVIVNNSDFVDLEQEIEKGEIRQLRKTYGGLFWGPRSELEIGYEFEEVNPAYKRQLTLMIDELKEVSGNYATNVSRNIGVVDIGEVPSFTWLGNKDFAAENKALLDRLANKVVFSHSFNPFHFIDKPLTMRVTTSDFYTLTLSRKAYSNDDWQVLYVTSASGEFVDENGVDQKVNNGFGGRFVCAPSGVSVYCRERVENEEFSNILYQTSPMFEQGFLLGDDYGGGGPVGRPGSCRASNCYDRADNYIPPPQPEPTRTPLPTFPPQDPEPEDPNDTPPENEEPTDGIPDPEEPTEPTPPTRGTPIDTMEDPASPEAPLNPAKAIDRKRDLPAPKSPLRGTAMGPRLG